MNPRENNDVGIMNDGASSQSEKATGAPAKITKVEAPKKADEERIPLVLRPCVAAYRAVPRVEIPFTGLNGSIIVVSFLALLPIRLLAESALPYLGWPPGDQVTVDAVASVVAGLQATFLLIGVGACLASQPYRPTATMDSAPLWWRDAARCILGFCTGYMAHDSLFLVVTARRFGTPLSTAEYCYLGHHFATSFCMASSQMMGAGHLSMMLLMFTGEMTSPLMNAHMVLRLAIRLQCCSAQWVHNMLAVVEYMLSILYCINRIFLGPMTAAYMTWDNLFTKQGRKNVHVLLTVVWLPLVWGVLIGSIPWIEESIEMLKDGLWNVKYGLDYDMGDRYNFDEL